MSLASNNLLIVSSFQARLQEAEAAYEALESKERMIEGKKKNVLNVKESTFKNASLPKQYFQVHLNFTWAPRQNISGVEFST